MNEEVIRNNAKQLLMLICICGNYQAPIFLEIEINLDLAQTPQFPYEKCKDHISETKIRT